jgi:predicted nucleotidyltransferase component of viral defense system
MSKDAKARSISMRLSTIARDRGIAYEKVLTEFLLERLVARLTSSTALGSQFIFKGGYVGRRAYGSPRYTVDVDALLRMGDVSSIRNTIIANVEEDNDDGTWFRFEETQDLQTQGEYPGVRFVFRSGVGSPLKDLRRAQLINLDIGVGDFVQLVELQFEPILDKELISWTVYSKEVMVAEKLHSLLSRPVGNSRSKDLFDLMFYLPNCNKDMLAAALAGTYKARGDTLPKNIAKAFGAIQSGTLKVGWPLATNGVEQAGSFEEAFRKVESLLKSLL